MTPPPVADEFLALEARCMEALVPLVQSSSNANAAVGVMAVVLGRALGMVWQAGGMPPPLSDQVQHVEQLVRSGLHAQLMRMPGALAEGSRV